MLPKRCLPPTSGGCGQQLIRGDFPRKRSVADQRHPLCRFCQSRRDADRYLMHRLRLADHWEEQGIFNCHICAGDFSEDDEIHIDHVWPRARGGTDDVWNMYPAHALCNMSKSDADPWEFLPRTLADAGLDFWAAFRAKP
ncbi:HNH endonuclease [Streptomyces althioticus]|uniref:HNH endonuclease n=1 Tax=Streptomyces althioticus TaxID=83380 RepID=UPI003872D799|nr:HNH endonuclease [Streptomyces althioticus]